MNDFVRALDTAARLIGHFDAELRDVVVLSLGVSLSAATIAFGIGAPFGTALAVYRVPGKGAFIVTANALHGLPPVVVGLFGEGEIAAGTVHQRSSSPIVNITTSGNRAQRLPGFSCVDLESATPERD